MPAIRGIGDELPFATGSLSCPPYHLETSRQGHGGLSLIRNI